MRKISEMLLTLDLYKKEIKDAINNKGVSVDDNMSLYGDAISKISGGGPEPVIPEILDTDPLTFVCIGEVEKGDSWLCLNINGYISSPKYFEYNKNDTGWQTYIVGTKIPVVVGDLVRFRSSSTAMNHSSDNYRYFSTKGLYKCGGNILSLKNNSSSLSNYDFIGLFKYCNITTAPVLPATTLAYYCYQNMFQGCTFLKTAPYLPATTLANNCYYNMFQGCTSLTTAPSILPATTLANSCYYNMFQGCTSLTTAPSILPATTLANSCYQSMFQGCSSLTTAPELSATTLQSGCCVYMFQGCTSLTQAPELPATTLANSCYQSMFQDCSSLTQAPSILPATTLANNCYQYMFYNCSSLKQAPELPATTLASSCYQYMFYNCSSLTQAPSILPATTLENSCYNSMFYNCSSLTQAPKLPATTLVSSCYQYMFQGCSNLNYIKADFTTTPNYTYTLNWVSGVASSGIFVKNPIATWDVMGSNGVPTGWTIVNIEPKPIDINNYCRFTTLDNQSNFSYSVIGGLTMGDIYYNLTGYEGDDVLWNGSAVTVPANSSIYIRNEGNGGSESQYMYYSFRSTNTFKIDGGNISNLKNADDNYTYYGMFYNTTKLVSVSDECMPNEPLKQNCYNSMFRGCTSLTTAPALPATTLAFSCYRNMFQDCTSLTTAPNILPAKTLANYCYGSMFQGCSSLTTAPELPATTLENNFCYRNMFQDCSNLNYIKADFTTTPSSTYTGSWVSGVASSGTFVKNPNATWNVIGSNGVPTGWTIVNS